MKASASSTWTRSRPSSLLPAAAELYNWPGAADATAGPALAPMDRGQAEERQREIQALRALLHGLVGLLIEKRVVGGRASRDFFGCGKVGATGV